MSADRAVHVVDDDASIRAALLSLLRSVDIDAHAFAGVDEFLAAFQVDRTGCLVLDVRLPGMSGLEFQEQLARLGIAIPVVMMTGYGDIPMSVRAMKAGAVDFLPKPFRDQDMLDAVCAALARDEARRHVARGLAVLHARWSGLSPREREVMALVVAGRLNKQAAGELGLSEVTVKIHRGSVMRKMQAGSLPELVRMAESLRAAGETRP